MLPLKKSIKLPLFECGLDAPATKMTTRELIALEQQVIEEEDIMRTSIPLSRSLRRSFRAILPP